MEKRNIQNKFVIDNTIFITEDQYKKYSLSKKVGLINISIELLHDLLDNDYFYSYVEDLFNGNIDRLILVYITENGVKEIKKYSKMDILNTISNLILNDEFIFNSKMKDRFKNLRNKISYDKLKEKYINDTYTCKIDDINIEVKVKSIFDFLELSNEEYEKFFNLDDRDDINGMLKEHFIYTLVRFFRDNDLYNNYYIPKIINSRYRELLTSKKIDLQAINKINQTKNLHSPYIKINEQLKYKVLEDIPKNFNKLETAIYIYIKLCDLLTYDTEYYASNNVENVNKMHENVNHIADISPGNNSVICYEFNAIYSKFLDEIGIMYETNASYSDIFGGGHEFLTFKSGKYLIKADSTLNSIIYSDIVNVKLNKKLNGFLCQNINENTQKSFKQILNKVYKIYFEQKKDKNINAVSFDDIILKYNDFTKKSEFDLLLKFKNLIYELKKSKLKGLDSLSYAYQLVRIIFNSDEMLNFVKFVIIKINYRFNNSNLCGIFSLKSKDTSLDNIYYLFNPLEDLIMLSLNQLEDLFNDGTLEYLDSNYEIPGLNIKIKKLNKF